MKQDFWEKELSFKTVCVFFFLFWLLVISIFFFAGSPSKIIEGSQFFRWERSVCIIEESALDSETNPSAVVSTVKYEFQGKQYQTQLTFPGESLKELQRKMDLTLLSGDELDCKINPEDPSQVVLDEEYFNFDFFWVGSIVFTIVYPFLLFIVFWWMRADLGHFSRLLRFVLNKAFFLLLCGLIFFIFGWGVKTAFLEIKQAAQSRSWDKVNATIQVCKITEYRHGKMVRKKLELEYSYQFNNQSYSGTRITPFEEDSFAEYRDFPEKYKPNDVVVCFVNPQNPNQAVLERPLSSSIGKMIFSLFMLALAIWVLKITLSEKLEKPESFPPEEFETILFPEIPNLPLNLKYELTRKQRLLPHLKIWDGIIFFIGFLFIVGFISLLDGHWIFFLVFLLASFLLFLNFWRGLLDIIFVSIRQVDIVIEENALGVILNGDRRYFFMDGITKIKQYLPDLITFQHYNGSVLHIPRSLLSDEIVEYIKTVAKWGKTPEGIKATIERGKWLREMENKNTYN